MRYHFATNKFTPIEGRPHYYSQFCFDGVGETVEAALEPVAHLVPEGFRVMAWWETERQCCPSEHERTLIP